MKKYTEKNNVAYIILDCKRTTLILNSFYSLFMKCPTLQCITQTAQCIVLYFTVWYKTMVFYCLMYYSDCIVHSFVLYSLVQNCGVLLFSVWLLPNVLYCTANWTCLSLLVCQIPAELTHSCLRFEKQSNLDKNEHQWVVTNIFVCKIMYCSFYYEIKSNWKCSPFLKEWSKMK